MRVGPFGLASLLFVIAAPAGAHASSYCPPSPCSNVLQINKNGQYPIKDVCDLEGIPANATGTFVLTQNIDATCTVQWGGFTMIPGAFAGDMEGNRHWINGLKMQSSAGAIGLFETIDTAGKINQIALTNVAIVGTNSLIGALASTSNGTIANTRVSGAITEPSTGAVGGAVGVNGGAIIGSFFNGVVNGQTGSGGLAGNNNTGAMVRNSSSAGIVYGRNAFGGLTGFNAGSISDSSSSAEVFIDDDYEYYGGGLVGLQASGGTVSNSYASGLVDAVGGSTSDQGGLIGTNDFSNPGITATNVYSVGLVLQGGGLVGHLGSGISFANAYWDEDTSGIGGDPGPYGTPEPDTTLRGHLLTGFTSDVWSIVPHVSFPFDIQYNCLWGGALANTGVDCQAAMTSPNVSDPNCTDKDSYFCSTVPPIMALFEPPLAQFVLKTTQVNTHAGVYTVLPVGQKQLFEYTSVAKAETKVSYGGKKYTAAAVACAGTAYTMLARLVGTIYPDAQVAPNSNNLCGVPTEPAAAAHIDCLLQKNGDGFWPKSLNTYAKLKGGGTLNDTDVEARLVRGQPIVLHGKFTNYNNGLTFDHFVVATSVIKSGSSVIRLVVNDPEVGMQLFIDMNAADTGVYHHAVFSPLGSLTTQDLLNFEQLSGYDFQIDVLPDGSPGKYDYLDWQVHS